MDPRARRATLLISTVLPSAQGLSILELWDLISEPGTNSGKGRQNGHLLLPRKQLRCPWPSPAPQSPQAPPSSHLPHQSWSNFSPLPYILIIQSPGVFSPFPSIADHSPPIPSSLRSVSCPEAEIPHTHTLCVFKSELPHSRSTNIPRMYVLCTHGLSSIHIPNFPQPWEALHCPCDTCENCS